VENKQPHQETAIIAVSTKVVANWIADANSAEKSNYLDLQNIPHHGSAATKKSMNMATSSTVLVIDDNPADILLLSEMLLAHGYQVAGALNGRDGFKLALAQTPSVILLDLYMPGLDGMETAKLIKSVPRLADVPILFLTGSADLSHKLKAFGAGAVDYVTKPFSTDEVLARIRVHVRLAQSAGSKTSEPALDASEPVGRETSHQRMVRKAQALLQKDLIHPPSGQELAHAVGTNEKRLNEIFRSLTGFTMFEFLRKMRHQKATELLLYTDGAMSHIAEQSGYSTAAAFAFAFRQQTGITPTEFRARAGIPAGITPGAEPPPPHSI
jgi:DNA-binding response OmpR family regulator